VIGVPGDSLTEEWQRLEPDPHTPVDAIEWTTDGGEKVTTACSAAWRRWQLHGS
jgi:hypothetical protein